MNMKIAYGCVFLAAFIPYLFAFLAKAGGFQYNNRNPREYLNNVTGWRKRANWAQLNSFEAFPAFAAAVIIAVNTHVSPIVINSLAVVFIVGRIAYGICYILDKPALRSLVWSVGFLCTMALFVMAITRSNELIVLF
jgi:uncharacterized MAPEG superfamily protein